MIIDTPTLHSVEYVYSLFVYDIIHDFKWITVTIEPQKQMFICGIIPNIIINNIDDSVPNSGFIDTMLEGRRVELNSNVHHFIIAYFQ